MARLEKLREEWLKAAAKGDRAKEVTGDESTEDEYEVRDKWPSPKKAERKVEKMEPE